MAISPLEYIIANKIEWREANAIKYISRYKAKNGIEDVLKSHWYISHLLKEMLDTLPEDERKTYYESLQALFVYKV